MTKAMKANGKNVRTDMRWHIGTQVRMLDTADFRNEMAGLEIIVRPGLEPPPHSHSREDEAMYVLRGDVEFTIGSSVVRPAPGEWIYLPRNVVHSYRVMSPDAHLLVMFTPGGLEGFYEALSEPVESETIPESSLSYDNLFDMEYIAELGRQFGLRFYAARAHQRAAAA